MVDFKQTAGAAADGVGTSHSPDRKPAQQGGGIAAGIGGEWYLVITLTLLTVTASMDRGVVALLVDPIRKDLGLSDTQISLLLGLSFALFNMLVMFPAGWIVDRFNRKRFVGIMVFSWSLTTASTGLANNFIQLFIGRAGVGFSEGGLAPASFSLIRDGVAPERHGRAFGVFGSATILGGAAALVLGGAVFAAATKHGPFDLPLVGEIKPWQMVFIAFGLCSLPFALLLLPITEPARRSAAAADSAAATGYRDGFRYMRTHWRIYVPLILCSCMLYTLSGANAAWSPTVAHRNYDITLPEVGLIMGISAMIAPTLGLYLSGSIIDRLTKAGRKASAPMVLLGVVILQFSPGIAAPLMPNPTAFWIVWFLLIFTSSGVASALLVTNARITPSHSAGKIFALVTLLQLLIGSSGGPLIVGVISDHLFTGQLALAHALSLTNALFLVPALAFAVWLLQTTRRFEHEAGD